MADSLGYGTDYRPHQTNNKRAYAKLFLFLCESVEQVKLDDRRRIQERESGYEEADLGSD